MCFIGMVSATWSDLEPVFAPPKDVAVTLSVPHCFEEAIHFDDVDAFRKISKSVGAPQAKKMFDNCGMLVNAVQQNRSILVSELLKGPESERANPDGRCLTIRVSNAVDQVSVVFLECGSPPRANCL